MAQNKKPKYKNVLVIRFSAIGDVAMTVPVLQSVARAYPDTPFTMLSNARFVPLFAGMPANVSFLGVDLKKDYHGFGAMLKLFLSLRKKHFDAVADIHRVLRTTALSFFYRLFFTKVRRIHKDRRSLHASLRLTATVLYWKNWALSLMLSSVPYSATVREICRPLRIL